MAISANQSEFTKAVCDALGLDLGRVRRLELVFEPGELVIGKAEIIAEDGLESVCKTFALSASER